MVMMRVLVQLVIECIRKIIISKEFKDLIFDMVSRAVFGTLNLINKASLFLYKKAAKIGKALYYKIDSFLERLLI